MALVPLQLPRFAENVLEQDPHVMTRSWYLWAAGVTAATPLRGTGDPEGVVIANAGTLYLRVDGSGPNLYIKEDEANNGTATGWNAAGKPGGGP